jgi:Bacterial Ig-like domain (group 2)
MFVRCLWGLSLVCLVLSIAGCGNPSGLDSIQITPATQSLTVGQTAQFAVAGTYGNANHPATREMSTGVSWTSSSPSVATVSASGVATAVGPGTTTITAGATAFNGPTTSSAALTVAGTGSGSSVPEPLVSLTIIPSSITVGNLQDTGQFLAIGTFATSPFVRDLTNSPTLTWVSSVPSVFPVNTNTAGNPGATAGIVSAYGNGSAVIVAEATGSDGTIQTATATFNCPLVLPNPPTTPGSCYPGSQAPALLATITVYNEGLNNTGWLVTAPSATGTPGVLHCGPGAGTNNSICVATYPVGATVTLTAPAESGVAFGGWSYNCTPTAPVTAAGPNSCTVTLTTNDTVGAIFNN